MQYLDLLFDRLVGPFTVQVVVLDGHEAAHLPIELLVSNLLQRVCLEVGMVKGRVLNLREKYNQYVAPRELACLSVLL